MGEDYQIFYSEENNITDEGIEYENPWDNRNRMYGLIAVIQIIITTIGNGYLIVHYFKRRFVRNDCSSMILSIAFTDLIFVIIVPTLIFHEKYYWLPIGQFICCFIYVMIEFIFLVHIYTLAIMTFKNSFALYTKSYDYIKKTSLAVFPTIIGIWIFCLACGYYWNKDVYLATISSTKTNFCV